MSQDQSINANEPTVSARLPRLERAYQKAASIRDRASALRTPAQVSIARRATRVIYYGAFAAMIGVLALIGAATLPTLFGYHTYAINGGSMEPALSLGSAAVTKPTSPFALDVGDIIARKDAEDGSSTLHRIVDISTVDGERLFITQGDQNRTPDATPVQLAGFGDRVVYSVPYAGYLLNFARSWLGRLLLLGTPLGFVAITFAGRFRSKWREHRSGATAVSAADNDGSLESIAAISETPSSTEDEHVEVETALKGTPPDIEGEPAVSEKAIAEAPGTIENPVAAMLTESTETQVAIEAELQEATPEAEDEPAAAEDTVAETPTDVGEDEPSENQSVEIEDAVAEAMPEEPIAIEAARAETPTEPGITPISIEAALAEMPAGVAVPDSPFPFEAALEAKAQAEAEERGEQPLLHVVPSAKTEGGLPAFLTNQLSQRHIVGDGTADEQEAEEESVA